MMGLCHLNPQGKHIIKKTTLSHPTTQTPMGAIFTANPGCYTILELVNIALHKPASMSTVCYGGENSAGTDGNTEPLGLPVVHTCHEAMPYYRIDLQQRYALRKNL